MKTNKQTNKLKGSVLTLLVLLFIGSIQSCHEDETSNESNQPITTSYNETILSYLANLKSAAGKENGTKIEAIKEAINLNTILIYNLKSTEKLLIADISTLKGFESYNATKVIFFVLNNSIIRSNIVTIKNKVPFDNVNQVLISIFDRKENKDNYSGKIEFYNLFKNILLSDEFENGKLTVNGVRRRSPNSSLTTKSNGCVAWYWVTTYFDGTQTKEYMYTTCDCEEQTYRGDCGGGAGSGGGSSSSNNNSAGPNYPDNPNDKDLYTYIDYDGEIVTRQYDMKSKSWIIVSIKLPDVVVNNNPEKYSFLIFAWPSDGQKILNNLILYTYDAASGNWNGEPETPEKIAEAIEEQINDSQLDPCTKAIMEKLKNLKICDIAQILTKLNTKGSLYNTTIKSEVAPSGKPAQSMYNSLHNYTIYISTDYEDKTKLFIAGSILHEMVHTYFMSLYDDYYSSNPPNTNIYKDYASLFHHYVTLKNPKSIDPADVHHQQIATDFVDAIARGLQEYQTGIPVPSTSTPNQVYSDIAWGGLSDAPVFDKIYPITNPSRERILNRYKAEQQGRTIGAGTSQAQSPLSQPCK